MSTDSNFGKPSTPKKRLLRCHACNRADEVSPADLLRYMNTHWPQCCGGVMALYIETDHPNEAAHANDADS